VQFCKYIIIQLFASILSEFKTAVSAEINNSAVKYIFTSLSAVNKQTALSAEKALNHNYCNFIIIKDLCTNLQTAVPQLLFNETLRNLSFNMVKIMLSDFINFFFYKALISQLEKFTSRWILRFKKKGNINI